MLIHAVTGSWFIFIVATLATWRITALLCYEAGPMNLLTRARVMLYKIKMGKLISCFHCTSVWIAAVITITLYQWDVILIYYWLAIAGGASLIEKTIPLTYHQTENNEHEND